MTTYVRPNIQDLILINSNL